MTATDIMITDEALEHIRQMQGRIEELEHITTPPQARRMQEVLDFLNSIEGAGYGGIASFEIARMTVKDMLAMQPTPATPAAKWRENSEFDPHRNRYDCERAKLTGGQLTDDQVANTVYLDPSIENLTIAKDRIRWLSRQLVAATTLQRSSKVTSEAIARTICLSYGRDPDALAPTLEMCTADNRQVPTWMVYEEQADAILAAYPLSHPFPDDKRATEATAEEMVPKRLLNERDDFIVSKGLWSEFTSALSRPHRASESVPDASTPAQQPLE